MDLNKIIFFCICFYVFWTIGGSTLPNGFWESLGALSFIIVESYISTIVVFYIFKRIAPKPKHGKKENPEEKRSWDIGLLLLFVIEGIIAPIIVLGVYGAITKKGIDKFSWKDYLIIFIFALPIWIGILIALGKI